MNDMTTEIELSLAQANQAIAIEAALRRLNDNEDFKQVVLQGYLHDEAVRLVHLKSAPSLATTQAQADIIREIDGIGSLIGYFQKLHMEANQSRKALADYQADLEFAEADEE